jgi:3-oxoacyl-(acyl-carrier-protein) synthase
MEEALLNLVNGVPIAAAVLYVWIVSDKNHMNEIAKWRETVEKKDMILKDMQEAITKLTTEISKLTYIIDNYVVRNRKNSSREQD